MTHQEVIRHLDLQPLHGEGGYYRQTWNSDAGTAIYFLLTPEEDGFSALHLLSEVEIYHFYTGDPVQLVLFPPADSTGDLEEVVLGNRLEKGESPQYTVPAGYIQGSRLITGGRWALMGTTMAPPYSPDIFQLSQREELLKNYPDHEKLIMQLTRGENT